MSKAEEVKSFLKDFKVKLGIYDVLFRDDRSKNSQTLLALEIPPSERRRVLNNLEPENYYQGPLDDTLYGIASLWVFGKDVLKREIYIKITMGRPGSRVICISFHKAEFPMNYPLKSPAGPDG